MIRIPRKVLDISGKKFGFLRAIKVVSEDKFKRKIWECVCDCGVTKPIPSRHLVQNLTISCGCHSRKMAAVNGKKSAHKISGKNSYLYKPELTDLDRGLRRNFSEIRDWRKAIYQRDNYTCDICGQRGGKLTAHHLLSWSKHRELRFDLNNGVTLCKKHHFDLHMVFGGPRFPCSPVDYESFRLLYIIDEIERLGGKFEGKT